MLNITEIRVMLRDKNPGSSMKAMCNFTVDNELVIKDVRIIKGKRDGAMFIAMPCRKLSTGEYRDLAHPISREARVSLEEAIMTEYRNEVARFNETQASLGLPSWEELSEMCQEEEVNVEE